MPCCPARPVFREPHGLSQQEASTGMQDRSPPLGFYRTERGAHRSFLQMKDPGCPCPEALNLPTLGELAVQAFAIFSAECPLVCPSPTPPLGHPS